MTKPLASILIPAYNERHFAAAFESALGQTYAPLEVVVCDDSPGTAIEGVVRRAGDARVRYVRNPRRLGFGANFTHCFGLARGDYVKFLNDDDVLRPVCVEVLAGALATYPAVTLATSRRILIDEAGRTLPDVPATTPLAAIAALFPARDLADLVLTHSVNFIGEPTTVLFRRAQVALEDGLLFRWGGRDYHCLADVSLWLRLLAQGMAYYHGDPLSALRRHPGQEQEKDEVRVMCLVERLWIVRRAREAGFVREPAALKTALASVKAQVGVFAKGQALDANARRSLEGLQDELDREIAAAGKAPSIT